MAVKTIIIFLILLSTVKTSHACSVCMGGDPGQLPLIGLRASVLFMLGLVAVVLLCIIKFLIDFNKRAKLMP